MDSAQDLPKGGVSPFGHPRINDRSHLPAAFRSVPRPSSPLDAKASTGRPYHAPAKTTASYPTTTNQPTNDTQAKPNAAATDAHPCRRQSGGQWTNEQLDGRTAPSITQHIQSRFSCERTNRRRLPAKPARGGGDKGFRRPASRQKPGQASRQKPAAPTHACMHARCTRGARTPCVRGPGGDRVRTDDPLLAKQVLSQLSYAPARFQAGQLAGWPAWAREDLNLRPHAYQACALTN
jgi:hypothetical protein